MRREGKGIVVKEKIENKECALRRYKVDRENNTYDEIVTDKNGKVIYKKHEPLDQHCGHGSAKKELENKSGANR